MSHLPILVHSASRGSEELLQQANQLYLKALHGSPSDVDVAIAHYRGALGGTLSLSSDAHSQILAHLANVLAMRFRQQGNRADLDCTLECHIAALALRPAGNPMRVFTLVDLATARLIRFKEDGIQNDVHLAIGNFRSALALCPPEHPIKWPLIMGYASALLSRFEYSRGAEDLECAIKQYQSIIGLSPPDELPVLLSNLANALQSRFQWFHQLSDLELSIQYSQAALHLLPTHHPDRLHILRMFASGLFERFHQQGDEVDLETAVKHYRAVLDLGSPGHPCHTQTLINLADVLLARFKHQGHQIDLDTAIAHYRAACIHSEGGPDQGQYLYRLGTAESLRFGKYGEIDYLHCAIENLTLALALHPVGHQHRSATMEALASCLQVRFEQHGELDDLRAALSYYDQTLRLCLEDHSRRPFILSKAASTLEIYFKHYDNLTELNRCISCYREALELFPATHVDRQIALNGLARALLIRFEHLGDEFDLDQALLHCTAALDARPPGHPARPTSLLTMARILRSRFLPWHDPKNLDVIFRHLRAAKDACQPGHPSLLDIHAELSTVLFLRYLMSQHSMDLKEALGYHELSMAFGSGGIWSAFRASLSWVQNAETFRPASAVDAYQTALRLLDRCVTITRAPELRQQLLRRHAELAHDAFSAAIRYVQPDLAVEMLEQGRQLLWSQLTLCRSMLDDLRSSGEQGARLADDFEQLSHQLEYGPRRQSGQKSPQHRRELQKSKDAVIMQIRRLDGFGHFLTHASYSDMQKAATDGPVIVVNASQYSCNAVIIYTTGQPILVSLPQITLADVAQLAARFEDIIVCAGDLDPVQTRERQLINLLTKLWHLVVSPVVDCLLPHTPKGSRIWWCPTGKFAALPLHAAGLYQCMESKLSHLYVSSYTPTLSSLIKSRRMKGSTAPCRASFAPSLTAFLKGRKVKPSRPLPPSPMSSTFAAICDSESTEDIDVLRNELPLTCTLTRLVGADATWKHVMRAIREQQWVHFALQAEPNSDLPFESRFPLCDRPIALWEISQALAEAERLPEFAFVSVGHRLGGSRKEEHEAMHLPHALHLAGFQSVVGAMWTVDEKVLRRIVSAFYHSLVAESNGVLNHANTAKALNRAVKMVEESIPLEQSIAFVHVGA